MTHDKEIQFDLSIEQFDVIVRSKVVNPNSLEIWDEYLQDATDAEDFDVDEALRVFGQCVFNDVMNDSLAALIDEIEANDGQLPEKYAGLINTQGGQPDENVA